MNPALTRMMIDARMVCSALQEHQTLDGVQSDRSPSPRKVDCVPPKGKGDMVNGALNSGHGKTPPALRVQRGSDL